MAQADTLFQCNDEFLDQTIRYLSYPSRTGGRTITVSGRLQMPRERSGLLPVVLIMHGSAGVSPRGVFYGNALNRAGIATFEVDQWGARGLNGGPEGRPKTVPETLPDIYGALDLLAALPEIDRSRIAIMGFSWGGVVTMLATTERYTKEFGRVDGPRFAAAMAFYPICWMYNRIPGYEFHDLSPIPLKIVIGSEDDYDDGATPCRNLLDKLPESVKIRTSLVVLQGASHAFDGFAPTYTHTDVSAHCGHGGIVTVGANPAARAKACNDVVAFFTQVLTR